MAWAIASLLNSRASRWRSVLQSFRRATWISPLTLRILAVNIVPLGMFLGGVLYLDQFHSRLVEQRRAELQAQAHVMATAFAGLAAASFSQGVPTEAAQALVRSFAQNRKERVRLLDARGQVVADSAVLALGQRVQLTRISYPLGRRIAEGLDRFIERAARRPVPLSADRLDRQPLKTWPIVRSAAQGQPMFDLRRRADGGDIVYVAQPVRQVRQVLGVVVLSADTQDIVAVVRKERLESFKLFVGVLLVTLLVSGFLASTIARPIRRLALAADRVRLGRARDVILPKLAQRHDEIGHLAQALADMTLALASRMDAIEGFAADVAHEIKNPLTSIRSAVETCARVRDPALVQQLLAVINDDVHRLDRLITAIADASRLDAELARLHLQPVNLAQVGQAVVRLLTERGVERGIVLAWESAALTLLVAGLDQRLGQVVRNLVENAISFSPDGGVVRVRLTRVQAGMGAGDQALLTVSDSGPGVPSENREDIFRRFYSQRPEAQFGTHSGLGLAISRQIVEAHGGHIWVEAPEGEGACFVVRLPVYDATTQEDA